jgi:hypothetical protein
MLKHGICKLTGNYGQFVASHLVPKALTRPDTGTYFISGGQGSLPKKSWSSWYDEELVIKKGERILADYDNWAISELRRMELVWSGWRANISLPVETPEGFVLSHEGFNLCAVECTNPDKLRLFFLSSLWRAAATTRPEFCEVTLEPDELERLRVMVLNGNPRPLDFYPMNLLQIMTRGVQHNLGPFVKDYGGKLSAFRFYFDGLIAIMFRNTSLEIAGRHIVGFSPTLWVQTQTWEHSFQFTNMIQHMQESTARWPNKIKKLTKMQRETGR